MNFRSTHPGRRLAAVALVSALAFVGCHDDDDEDPSVPNAQMQAVLDELAALGAQPVEALTVQQARTQPTPANAVASLLAKSGMSTAPEAVAQVADSTFPGPAGAVPIRIYTPTLGGPALPLVLYIHGGGWVIADLDTYDASARALANASNAIVVSTHYRQGPESKFPAAHDDTFAAYQWVLANAAALGGDPTRVAVAGESAGGNMAASIAVRARDAGLQLPVHQLLVYPVAQIGTTTESYTKYANAMPLSVPAIQWFGMHYLNSPADGSNPLINLLLVPSLAGLPPATVITAEIDPLQSEGRQYAEKLQAAGVTVDYANYGGVTHEFFGMCAVVDRACEAVSFGAAGLRRSFGN